jgi:hypothetical protein
MSHCIHCTWVAFFVLKEHRDEQACRTEAALKLKTFVACRYPGIVQNMIDLCPVGAIDQRPFLPPAPALGSCRCKPSVSVDSTGANLTFRLGMTKSCECCRLKTKLPTNADCDWYRFPAKPLMDDSWPPHKQGGEWKTVDWQPQFWNMSQMD